MAYPCVREQTTRRVVEGLVGTHISLVLNALKKTKTKKNWLVKSKHHQHAQLILSLGAISSEKQR